MENGTGGPVTTNGDEADWEALARFLAGESTPAEADAVRAWLAADPARQQMLDRLDAAIDRAVPPPAGVDVEAALARVHARMDEEADARVIPFRAPARRTPATGWGSSPILRIAAMLVVLVGGALLISRLVGGGGSGTTVYLTGVGERDSVRLPDGTRVLLGPDSRLSFADGYGRSTREVELDGEALFDAVHDDARPFTVHAGAARVRDLGTTFSVRAGDADVRVVVTHGAVVLSPESAPSDSGVVLREGDRGMLEAGRQAVAERAAATDDDLAWTRGRLVFRDAPLPRVAVDLRRWYGVELRADDPALAGRRLTADFAGEAPERVLQAVALALGAEVEMRGDTAVLRPAR